LHQVLLHQNKLRLGLPAPASHSGIAPRLVDDLQALTVEGFHRLSEDIGQIEERDEK
jgi:hypothetical protein